MIHIKICTDDEFLKNKGSVGEDIYDKGYYLKDVLLYVSESKMESIDDKTKIANEMTKFLYNDLLLNPRTAKSLIDNYEKNEYNSEKIVSCLMQEKEGGAKILLKDITEQWEKLFCPR